MSHPWEPDYPLTLNDASVLIRQSFPAIDSSHLTHIGSGWEFDAYLTTDGWVFRFPHRAEGAALFDVERRVHKLVMGRLPPGIAIPRVQFAGQPSRLFPYPFAGHAFIPGIPADEVDPEFLPSLATQIGKALGAIHAIPESTARQAGVVEMEVDDEGHREWYQQRVATLTSLPAIDPVVEEAAAWVRQVSLPLGRFEGPLRLIHHDLSPEHVIVDPETGRLCGIIDWTDAILGDAARDFVFLVAWQGWPFAEEVLRSYPHKVDAGFRERLDFMARILSVAWLALAYDRHTEIAKLTRWVHNVYAPQG
jgi:aminoglycoside phosphotransferase (APT) family kinase protein